MNMAILCFCTLAFNFLSLPLSLAAQASRGAESTRKAEVLYEAGRYDEALVQYQLLHEDPLPTWQQAIIQYNIGTVLLAQGKWAEALLAFEAASTESAHLPLLKLRLTLNKTITRLLLAQSEMKKLKTNTAANDQDYQEVIGQYREVLEDLKEASEASCELEKATGAKQCDPQPEIKELEKISKSNLKQLLQDYENYRLNHMALEEGLAILAAGLEELIGDIKTLKDKNIKSEFNTNHLNTILEYSESWEPLWKKVLSLNVQLTADQQPILNQAWQSYNEGVNALKKEDLTSSQANFESSIKALEILLKSVNKGNSLQSALKRLVTTYGSVLSQEPLQKISVEALVKLQAGLNEAINESKDEKLKESYDQAQEHLTAGSRSLINSKPFQSRIFLETALYEINEMLQSKREATQQKAEAILQQSIALEHLVRKLSRLYDKAQTKEKIASENEEILVTIQTHVLQVAKTFKSAALKQQKENFGNQGESTKKSIPWNEVLPLFNEGEQAAQQAKEALTNNFKLAESIKFQEKALEKWKQALAKMKSGATDEKSSSSSSAKQSPDNQPQSKPQQNRSADNSIDNVLKSLQEMENDDRSKPELKSVPTNKGEERPW